MCVTRDEEEDTGKGVYLILLRPKVVGLGPKYRIADNAENLSLLPVYTHYVLYVAVAAFSLFVPYSG